MPITQQQQPGKHSFWQFANKTCAYDIRRRLAKKLWQKSVKHTYRIIHSPFTDTHSWYKKLTTNFRPTNAEAKYRTWILFIAKNRDRRSPCLIIPLANIMLKCFHFQSSYPYYWNRNHIHWQWMVRFCTYTIARHLKVHSHKQEKSPFLQAGKLESNHNRAPCWIKKYKSFKSLSPMTMVSSVSLMTVCTFKTCTYYRCIFLVTL